MSRDTDSHDVAQIIENQREVLARLATLQDQMRDVLMELGDVPDADYRDPDRRSIRRRLHDLEEMKHAASAAGAALGLLFGRAAKFTLIACSVVAAVASALRLFGVGG